MLTLELGRSIISYGLKISYYILKGYALFLAVVPIPAVYQEAKIWKNPNLPSLSVFGMMKVYVLNLIWITTTSIGTIILLPKLLLKGHEAVKRDAHCLMERIAAISCTIFVVGPVKVINQQNLPSEGTPCIYIANHASQIDLAVVYFIFRRFKWIAKKSVTYLPGVGTLMAMSGHVFIERKKSEDKNKSVKNMYDEAKKNLSNGIPMFIFPQGTRRLGERLPFKYGAYKMAVESEVPLVPISIDIPLQVWNDAYPFNILWTKKDPIVLTIHEPIPVKKDMDMDVLIQKSSKEIYSVLPNFDDKNQNSTDSNSISSENKKQS